MRSQKKNQNFRILLNPKNLKDFMKYVLPYIIIICYDPVYVENIYIQEPYVYRSTLFSGDLVIAFIKMAPT